ncbi:MAG: hypothetical protein K8R25_14170 [Methanosarcinales archaeon]|nr:hypothetical protein [Methanosarcinales archaeon]
MRYITKEDRTVAALTILSVIALMGVVMLPGAVAIEADCWVGVAAYAAINGANVQQTAVIGLAGAYHTAELGLIASFVGGPGAGAVVSFGVGA